jgi:hypothetical protein
MEKSEQISKACFRDIFDFDKAPPDSYSWPRIAALSVVYATDIEIDFPVAVMQLLSLKLPASRQSMRAMPMKRSPFLKSRYCKAASPKRA